MARTYADLLKFQEMYGIPPEQSAGAFGVELPPPVVDAPIAPVAPMDLGGALPPAHPGMLSDPGLEARNGPRQGTFQQAEINLDQQPEINLDAVPATGTPWTPPSTWDKAKMMAKDIGGAALNVLDPPTAADAAKRTPVTAPLVTNDPKALGYQPGGDWRDAPEGRAKAEELAPEVANQQDLLASMGGGQAQQGGAPAITLSPEKRRQMAMARLGFNEAEYANAQDKAIDASEMALRSRAVAQDGTQALSQFYTDTAKATSDFYKEVERERARAAQQEQADRQAVMAKSEDIIAKAAPSATTKIGQMIAYAMAGFGNAMSVRHGGQATDIVNQMIARDDQSAERVYQKALQTVDRLKVDQATKDKMRRQAILDRTANFVASRSAVMDQLNALTQSNSAKLQGAQIDEIRAKNESLMTDKNMQLQMGIRQATEATPSVIGGGGPASRVAKVDEDSLVQHGTAPDGTPIFFSARSGKTEAPILRKKIESSRSFARGLTDMADQLENQGFISLDPFGVLGKDDKFDTKKAAVTLAAKSGLTAANSDKDMELIQQGFGAGGSGRPVLGFKATQMAARLRARAAEEQKVIDDAPKTHGIENFAQVVDPRTGAPVYIRMGPIRNLNTVTPVTGNKPKVP